MSVFSSFWGAARQQVLRFQGLPQVVVKKMLGPKNVYVSPQKEDCPKTEGWSFFVAAPLQKKNFQSEVQFTGYAQQKLWKIIHMFQCTLPKSWKKRIITVSIPNCHLIFSHFNESIFILLPLPSPVNPRRCHHHRHRRLGVFGQDLIAFSPRTKPSKLTGWTRDS